MKTRSRQQLANTETMTKFIYASRTEPLQMPRSTKWVMRSELVMWSLQPIMFIQRQYNSSTISPHQTKLALPCIKQNLHATCLYVTVEFASLRSRSWILLWFAEEERIRSQKWDSVHLCWLQQEHARDLQHLRATPAAQGVQHLILMK